MSSLDDLYNKERRVVHIDMDAFYASVEQRDNPDLRGKPVIVGGAPSARGVVATCSYEARQYKIHSAMASATAVKLCPQAIFIKPRFDVYRQVSEEVFDIFRTYTDLFEPLSLDEAYLDLTLAVRYQNRSATELAIDILKEIKRRTRLTASAGISYNKFLAKIASDIRKPDGYFTIPPEKSTEFINALPVRKFHGIGKVTEQRMQAMGIQTGADLKNVAQAVLIKKFGKVGEYYYQIARGLDDRPVIRSRERKSVGAEVTLEHDLKDKSRVLAILEQQARKVAEVLVKKEVTGRTVVIKIKYDNFEQITRSVTFDEPLASLRELMMVLPEQLDKTDVGRRAVRLVGIAVSNLLPTRLYHSNKQLNLL